MQMATKTTHVRIGIHNLIAYKNVKALIVMFVNHDRFANICQCCSAPLRYWVKCSIANTARQKLMFNDSVATATVVFGRPCSFASRRPILFRFQIQPAYNRAHLIIYTLCAICDTVEV